MIKQMKGDAVMYAKENDNVLLIHVCNDKAVMGSGIAAQIKKVFPSAFKNYREGKAKLGVVSYSDCGSVANMIAQSGYRGYNRGDTSSARFLNYGALADCLQQIEEDKELQDLGIDTLTLPKLMGADRAGGDWGIVLELVEYYLGGSFEIVVCEL